MRIALRNRVIDIVGRFSRIIQIRRQRVFVLDRLEEMKLVQPRLPLSIFTVTSENVERIGEFRTEDVVRHFQRFLKAGEIGVFAERDGRVVGHAWGAVCRKETRRVNDYFKLRQGEALIHFCSVQESWRGLRIYPAMLSALVAMLFTGQNLHRVFIDTGIDNLASVRGILKVGFRPLGRYLYVIIRGRCVLAFRYRRAQLGDCDDQ
jgi:RimJ/RimL family protein N-acetyltransferase